MFVVEAVFTAGSNNHRFKYSIRRKEGAPEDEGKESAPVLKY